jgi:ABC-2 type transport system permease protein
MRFALLVALREYAENVRTKGFWIGIFVFPVLLWISFSAGEWIQKTISVRNFVVVDASGELGPAIDRALERLQRRKEFAALNEWARRNQATKITAEDLERIPAGAQDALSEWGKDNPEALDRFIASGGWEFAQAGVRPYLRPDAPDFVPPRSAFRRVPLPEDVDGSAAPAEVAAALKPYLRGDKQIELDGEPAELFAAVIVPADIFQHVVRPGAPPALGEAERAGVQYWSVNLADEDLKDCIETAVQGEVREREYRSRGMDGSVVSAVQRSHVPFAALDPKKEAGEEAVSLADKIRQWAPVAFVYALWIAIFSISQMLLNNTIEEKSNRIIEVLLSSVTPGELMSGKLIGIACVGLTMLGAWIAALVGILQLKASEQAELATEMLKVLNTSGLLLSFVVYFVLGYLLYASAFLAIGSVCNTLKEAQNMMGPIMLVMVVPIVTMAFIPKEPNGTLARALSWVPIYTPFVMMNRAAADPPLVDRVGTLVLLVASTVLMIALCGRIFRVGVLRTGQPPKLLELLRWVRSPG